MQHTPSKQSTRYARYARCHTCGRYMPSSEKYCGETCAQRYQTCETCGRHFPQGQGYSERHCSADCAVQYKTIRPGHAQERSAGTLVEELS